MGQCGPTTQSQAWLLPHITGDQLKTLGGCGPVTSVFVMQDGETIVSGYSDNIIRLRKLSTGVCLCA